MGRGNEPNLPVPVLVLSALDTIVVSFSPVIFGSWSSKPKGRLADLGMVVVALCVIYVFPPWLPTCSFYPVIYFHGDLVLVIYHGPLQGGALIFHSRAFWITRCKYHTNGICNTRTCELRDTVSFAVPNLAPQYTVLLSPSLSRQHKRPRPTLSCSPLLLFPFRHPSIVHSSPPPFLHPGFHRPLRLRCQPDPLSRLFYWRYRSIQRLARFHPVMELSSRTRVRFCLYILKTASFYSILSKVQLMPRSSNRLLSGFCGIVGSIRSQNPCLLWKTHFSSLVSILRES